MRYVSTLGLAIDDLGPFELDPSDDYPDFVHRVTEKVASESGSRGIIVGGSGQGEAMAANRNPGIRALLFYGRATAFAPIEAEGTPPGDGFDIVRLSRRHNDANVLSLGARFVSGEDAREAVKVFLETDFSGEERHRRRIEKF